MTGGPKTSKWPARGGGSPPCPPSVLPLIISPTIFGTELPGLYFWINCKSSRVLLSLLQCFSTFWLEMNLRKCCVAHGTLWHRVSQHKGSSMSKQLINGVFNAIHSGKDTVEQWLCYNRIELWLLISFQTASVCFGGTPGNRNPWYPEVPRNPGWNTLLYCELYIGNIV